MKYKKLFDSSIIDNIAVIKDSLLSDSGTVFVYSGQNALYDFIDELYDDGKGLDDKCLYGFKVCYEKNDLSLSYSADGGRHFLSLTSMSALIDRLDGTNSCVLVVENDSRTHLAFIVQQLIFVEYPLEKVDFFLRCQFNEGIKISKFLRGDQNLGRYCKSIIMQLSELRLNVSSEKCAGNPTKFKRLCDIDAVLTAFYEIKKLIGQIANRSITLSVAASKKAGKSVLVNCLLDEELSPTSTETATPNNCVFKISRDGAYHLQLGDSPAQEYKSGAALKEGMNSYFREAQNNDAAGFSLPDMHIEYVSDADSRFSAYTIVDTAGPDAAGTYHADAAKRAVSSCDVAVFVIDYSKYLTISEDKYLRSIKQLFKEQNKLDALILALNKLDVRYTDYNSPKSSIKSVDFIKTRLGSIDASYQDLVIFPVSALEYLNATVAAKAGVKELEACNNLSVDKLKSLKFARRDVPELNWLHTHAENLETYHGMTAVSYDVFQKDSGLPALMKYADYIVRNKAHHNFLNDSINSIGRQANIIRRVISRKADSDKERRCIEILRRTVDNKLMISLNDILSRKN